MNLSTSEVESCVRISYQHIGEGLSIAEQMLWRFFLIFDIFLKGGPSYNNKYCF
jgi:hypothetical protein